MGCCAALASPSPRTHLALGTSVLGWQRAADHAALVAPAAAIVHRGLPAGLGFTVELDGGHSRDRNASVLVASTPLRSAITLDAALERTGVRLVGGVGAGVLALASRTIGDDLEHRGWSASPLLRLRGGVDGPLRGRVGLRAWAGCAVRRGGTDWDSGLALTVSVGR